MFKCFIRNIIILSMLAISAPVLADEDLKILYVGNPQAGPPLVQAQSFAQNIKVPSTFVSLKDCPAALQTIDKNSNVVFLVSDLNTIASTQHGENCLPKIEPKDIVYTTKSTWQMCRAGGSHAVINTRRSTIGIISILPINGFVSDFNKLNGTNLVPVALYSSAQVITSIINGDVDWGLVNPGVAGPLVEAGKLDCPYTFEPDSPKNISRFFKTSLPEMSASYVVVAKTNNPAVRAEIVKAAQSPAFAQWLTKTGYYGTKATNLSSKDIDSFNAGMQKLTEFYNKEK